MAWNSSILRSPAAGPAREAGGQQGTPPQAGDRGELPRRAGAPEPGGARHGGGRGSESARAQPLPYCSALRSVTAISSFPARPGSGSSRGARDPIRQPLTGHLKGPRGLTKSRGSPRSPRAALRARGRCHPLRRPRPRRAPSPSTVGAKSPAAGGATLAATGPLPCSI